MDISILGRRGVVAIAVALGFLVLSMPQVCGAADCKACQTKQTELQSKEAEIQKHVELLGKNREYLTRIDPNQVSKIIKIDSNIKMILMKIDALKKDAGSIQNEMRKEGCESCTANNKT